MRTFRNGSPRPRADRPIAAALGIAALAAALAGIVGGPMIGMADNGDFLRVMTTAGIGYASDALTYADKYFNYAIFEFRNVPLGFGGYASTHLLFLFLAKAVNAVASGGGAAFHIAALGAVYAAAFAGAVVLTYTGLQAGRAVRLAVCGLLVAVYADTAYTAYYHSFYGEPVSLLGFLYAIGCGLHAREGGRLRMFAFFAAIVLFMGAKAQNFAVGLVFFGLLLLWSRLSDGREARRTTLVLSAAALLLGFAFYAAAPQELKRINLYQTVFYGILKHSDDVPADLRALGLPEELAPLAGTNFFESGTAIPQTSPRLDGLFYDRIGHADVALYYLQRPGKLYERLAWAAEHSTTIRPYYLGSYAKEAGREPGAVHLEGAWWSEWKKAHVPKNVWFAAALGTAYTALLAFQGRRPRGGAAAGRTRLPSVLYGVPWIALLAYVTPIVGDGDADLAKHLFLYNVAFDFMALYIAGVALGGLAQAAGSALRRPERLRRRAGRPA